MMCSNCDRQIIWPHREGVRTWKHRETGRPECYPDVEKSPKAMPIQAEPNPHADDSARATVL